MPPSIPVLNITEDYDSLKILRETQLNTAMASIEAWCNTNPRNDIVQIALDTFGIAYVLNHDGIATYPTPLQGLAALLADNEIITGSWTFNGTLAINNVVSGTSIFSSSAQHRCRIYRTTANQNVADATATAISYQAETYDTQSLHDNSTNPSRITIPSGGSGLYLFQAQVTFDNNAVGRREIYIYKNGSQIAVEKLFNPDAVQDSILTISIQESCSISDFFEIFVFQNSGGGLDIVQGERVTFFSALKVW